MLKAWGHFRLLYKETLTDQLVFLINIHVQGQYVC